MNRRIFCCLLTLLLAVQSAMAGPATAALRETSEWILGKFGRGAAGKTADEIAVTAARVVEKHGDAALPLLRASGHAGFEALETAGKQAPDVLKLFARKGDEAIWVISQPKKLTIFLRHGDDAADALLKHPGLADDLIGRFGAKALGPLKTLERTSAQRMAMAAGEGVFERSARSPELLGVIGKFGDRAMEFIWKHKGALAVTGVLAAFLNDPEPFIQGTKDLLAIPIGAIGDEVARRTNWTLFLTLSLVSVASVVAFRIWLRSRRQAVRP